ncbi:MAG: alpha/beta hydrolase [Anaerolineae bacterium]|nr:alpha/beta hydrolase [Anaerolineae bacterium]
MAAGFCLTAAPAVLAQETAEQSGYADVNDLHMYYEIHGAPVAGEPLVVLHGAYASINLMGEFVPRLAETRQVIAPELQGHGRTADIDRPLSYEQMADDVAALLAEIGVEKADFYGYSMGGGVALQVAIRHPELVDRLIVASMPYNSEGYHAGMIDMIKTLTPEAFAGSPPETDYLSIAPNPEDFPRLVEKLVALDSVVQDWPAEDIQGIQSPTLLIFGDSDVIQLEHAVEMFQLRGGDVNGDLVGLPSAQLAILPATTHIGVMFRTDWVTSMVAEFLDAPLPETTPAS